jgi:hypothetical protein
MTRGSLTPSMRMALLHVGRAKKPNWPKDIPGGKRSVEALERRGLVVIVNGRVVLTHAGRAGLGSSV